AAGVIVGDDRARDIQRGTFVQCDVCCGRYLGVVEPDEADGRRHVVSATRVGDGHPNESADGIEDGGPLCPAAVTVHGGEHDCRSVHVDEAPRVVDGDAGDGAADGVEPDAAALVDGSVAGDDGAGVDVDDARAIGVDATPGVARVVVT